MNLPAVKSHVENLVHHFKTMEKYDIDHMNYDVAGLDDDEVRELVRLITQWNYSAEKQSKYVLPTLYIESEIED